MPDVWVLSPWIADVSGTKMPAVVYDYPTALGWSDMTGQIDADVLAGLNQSVIVGRLADAQTTALRSDTRYVVLAVGDPLVAGDMTGAQITALVAGVTAALSSDVASYATDSTASPETIIARLVEVNTRPVWRAGLVVTAGHVYHHAGNLYEVIQAHTTQADWTPNHVPALFKRFHEPGDDPWPWEQPAGAHDAYPLGARVLHGGYSYVSLIAANVWEPGGAGADALWDCENCPVAPPAGPWQSGSGIYAVGDRCTYGGRLYECIQNPGVNIWTPNIVPALWRDIGAA